MKSGPFSVPFPGGDLPGVAYAAKAARATMLLAHGAGAGQSHPYMVSLAERLRDRAIGVVTFDFPYRARGKKVPDAPDVLEAALRAALGATRERCEGALVAGGKSMGGRIASQVAAKDAPADLTSLVFLGYPFHPPGKPQQRRDRHLPGVRVPMLFVQGTRDPFGGPDELAPIVATCAALVRGTRVHVVEGGDHSHAVLKRGGVPQAQVDTEIADAIAAFILASAAPR